MNADERVEEVLHAAFSMRGPRAFTTPHGTVVITAIEGAEDSEGVRWVEVWTGGPTVSGESHYRIFNPPTMAGGKLDPLQAIAEAIGKHGGSASTRKGRR